MSHCQSLCGVKLHLQNVSQLAYYISHDRHGLMLQQTSPTESLEASFSCVVSLKSCSIVSQQRASLSFLSASFLVLVSLSQVSLLTFPSLGTG